VAAYTIVPSWRMKQLSSPYPWLAALIAVAIFSPVLYWNAIHDWVSFRFQLDRPTQMQGWSLKFLGEFVGFQFFLLGPILFPLVVIGTARLGWRGFRAKEPVAILLSVLAHGLSSGPLSAWYGRRLAAAPADTPELATVAPTRIRGTRSPRCMTRLSAMMARPLPP